MARQEAKVRVRLDTRQAKGDLKGLVKDSSRTATKIGRGVRSTIQRGLTSVGLGAGIGAGISAVRSATESGLGTTIGEALGGFSANLANRLLGDLDEKAAAARSAREETISAFGTIAGATGRIPPEAVNYFNSIRSLRLEAEKGRDLFQRDPRFRGPDIGEVGDRVLTGLAGLLRDGFDYLAERLSPY